MVDYQYITFDCYGTLIDWRRGIREALVRILGHDTSINDDELLKLYVEIEAEEEKEYKSYREILKNSVLRLANKIGEHITDELANKFVETLPSWPAFDDTERSLAYLRNKGFTIYILSNIDNDLLELTIKERNLKVDGYVTAEEVRSYKPNYAHWLRFLSKTGARKERVLHAAQSIFHDLIPANRLGIKTAWVNRYNDRLTDIEPDYICTNLDELIELILAPI